MADGILAAVNENGNIDRFIDTKGGVHYIEPKRYEESVAKIDAAATKAKETVNSATEAVSECKAQTGACTQETARAKEIADTVERRITGIEGDVAALRDSVSHASGKAGSVSYFKTAGIVIVSCLFAKVTINSSWGSATIGRLPEGFRPAVRVIVPIASDWAKGNMSVAPDGTVNINSNDNKISTAASISTIAVFPAAQ